MTISRAGSCAPSLRLALSLPDTHERMNILQSAAPAAPGGMPTRTAAPSYLWPGTNDNAPVYSIAERAGVDLCPARASGGFCGPFCGAGIYG